MNTFLINYKRWNLQSCKYYIIQEMEYDFYRQLDGKVIKLPEGKYRYKIVNTFKEIEAIQKAEETVKIKTISIQADF